MPVNWLFLFHSSLHLLQLQTSFLWWMQQHTIFSPAFQSQNHRKIHQPKDFRLGLQTLMLACQRQWCSVALSALHQAQPYRWWGYRKEEWIQLPEGSKAPDYVAPLYSPWTACALLNPSSFTLCALCIICMSYLAAPVAWPWISASCVAWA